MPEVDTNKVRESLADFDRSHPTQGSCQHERYWRNALPGIIAALDAKDREIERLRAENARLREALKEFVSVADAFPDHPLGPNTKKRFADGFRAALAPSDEMVADLNPNGERCGLCGRVARGHARVTTGDLDVRLCHDTAKRTCYVRWAVYGERPAAPSDEEPGT